jgi:hypothetical protein
MHKLDSFHNPYKEVLSQEKEKEDYGFSGIGLLVNLRVPCRLKPGLRTTFFATSSLCASRSVARPLSWSRPRLE